MSLLARLAILEAYDYWHLESVNPYFKGFLMPSVLSGAFINIKFAKIVTINGKCYIYIPTRGFPSKVWDLYEAPQFWDS